MNILKLKSRHILINIYVIDFKLIVIIIKIKYQIIIYEFNNNTNHDMYKLIK